MRRRGGEGFERERGREMRIDGSRRTDTDGMRARMQ